MHKELAMIVEASNGYLILDVDGRRITVYGERGNSNNSPTFMAFTKMLTKWDNGDVISAVEKEKINNQLRQDFQAQKWTIEIR
jgi:hypothetical protein